MERGREKTIDSSYLLNTNFIKLIIYLKKTALHQKRSVKLSVPIISMRSTQTGCEINLAENDKSCRECIFFSRSAYKMIDADKNVYFNRLDFFFEEFKNGLHIGKDNAFCFVTSD